jgi:chemotaxis protein methyltransferase CheR
VTGRAGPGGPGGPQGPAPLADADFRALRGYLLATAGLVFDQSRRASLASVVAERMAATGVPGVASYLALVASPTGAAERQRLLDGVTVQETHFFRNGPQMEALRRRVLPELLRRAAGRDRPLTVWSAGCSTGEEPYTLAMLLLELAPAAAAGGGVRIVATDVSARALQDARRATYSGRTLELTSPEARAAWFESRAGGSLTVAASVRRLVDLQLHNLVTDPAPFAPGEVDLVVCRNVTIYFDRPTTRSLVGSFHRVLAEGGYLLLGHSETLWQVSDDFALVPVGDAFVYRRSHDARQGASRRRRSDAVRRAPAPAPRPAPLPAAPPRRVTATRTPAPAAAAAAPSAADLLSQARRRIDAGDYPGAAAAAEAAVRADQLLTPAYVVLGRARTSVGQDADAVGPLRKAVYLAPSAGDAHFLLAGALARLGQHAAAAAAYRAAAGTLARLDSATLDDLFGGRDLAELVDLCLRLAERSVDPARDVAPVIAGGAS